jgi:putative ATP-binding cassette transporter
MDGLVVVLDVWTLVVNALLLPTEIVVAMDTASAGLGVLPTRGLGDPRLGAGLRYR